MTRRTIGVFWSERIGSATVRARLLDRPIPAEVGWLHTLGSVTLCLILVLGVTGILLALNYSASTEHAYHSVRYVDTVLIFGGLIRGLHHWAATFLVVAITLHLGHVLARLSFARPREITWCTGILLLLVVLAFGFTGYLLPWDEKAYWATVVGTSMVEQFPFAGEFLLRLVRGGAEVGAATLSRFYGAHVTLLPALLILLAGFHLYLVVLHGISARDGEEKYGASNRGVGPTAGDDASVPFWPEIVAMDAAAVLLTLALLFFFALTVGTPLEAPADPTNTGYVPRPEWYFLPLFELLTFFPGHAESLAAVGIPLVGALLLLWLPWWSRPLLRRGWGKKALVGGAGLSFTGVLVLGVAGALAGELEPVEPLPEVARGRLLFDQLGCVNCHSIRGAGGVVGPDLTLVGLRRPDSTWLTDHLRDPRSIVPRSPMPPFPLEGGSLTDLVAFLLSLGNDLRHTPAAEGLYAERCMACHQLAGRGGTFGPDLGRIGRIRSVAYIHEYIENPAAFLPDTRMPPTVGMSHEEVEDVARYIAFTARFTPGRR